MRGEWGEGEVGERWPREVKGSSWGVGAGRRGRRGKAGRDLQDTSCDAHAHRTQASEGLRPLARKMLFANFKLNT